MAIFDILKKKKKFDRKILSIRSDVSKTKKEKEKKNVSKKEDKLELKTLKSKKKIRKTDKVEVVASSRSHSGPSGQGYKALESPHITEKATGLAKENQYVFKILKGANKIEIKKAIRSLYKVDVETVRIINIPSRKIRLGRIEGWKKGYKKAIIKIKKGQKIEILAR